MKRYKVTVLDPKGRVLRTFKGYGSSDKQVLAVIGPTLEAMYGKRNGNYTVTIEVDKKNPCGSRSNPRMVSIGSFIRENREIIDTYILRQVPNARIDDMERRLWVLNDEGLYNWALSEDVNI